MSLPTSLSLETELKSIKRQNKRSRRVRTKDRMKGFIYLPYVWKQSLKSKHPSPCSILIKKFMSDINGWTTR